MSDSEESSSTNSQSTAPPSPTVATTDTNTDIDIDIVETNTDIIHTVATNGAAPRDGSILFQPHRTIGIISTSQPFTLSNGTSHLDRFVTMPLQERFVIYKCDSLKPVLVSDPLKGTRGTSSSRNHAGEKLYEAISDSSLGVTLVTHGCKGRWSASHVTLYKRTRGIQVRKIVRGSSWGIVNVVNLGKSKFPLKGHATEDGNEMQDDEAKDQKMENCMVLALICAKNTIGVNDGDGVDIVGESDDEDDASESDSESMTSESDSNSDGASDSEDDDDDACNGGVVIVIVSRRNVIIQKRIPLSSVPDFVPTVAMHPHTYLNKILIGGANGDLILVNVRSGKVVHKFKCLHDDTTTGAKITALEQSPAVDTVAVGTATGMVHLTNIRMDVKLFSLAHAVPRSRRNKGKAEITSLSFRTDALALEHGIAPLAVGQMNGTISVWDLTPRSNDDSDDEFASSSTKDSRRTLLCQMELAHKGGVAELMYLPQEPLLLSSGVKSNSLVMYIFDNPNHTGRILRQRVGHVAPPGLIRYQHSSNGGVLASMADGTDAASCQILSCGGKGDNTLRVFSTARSVLDREYGQGRGLDKKARELGLDGGKSELLLKPITGIASCETKAREWGDLVTIHRDHAIAYVWSTKRKAQSGPVLRQEEWNVSAMKTQPPMSAHATSVAMSSCGNFAVVGTAGGVIYKYNIQSGMPRGSFPRDATDATEKLKRGAKVAGNVNRTTKMLERTLKVYKLHNVEEKDLSAVNMEARMKTRLQLARHVDAAVVGLAVDTLNKTLVSVGSDAKLILWSFATHAPHQKSPIRLSAPATKLVHARDSNLLAIVLEDFSTILFDCSALSVVRRFSTVNSSARHTGPISDVAFGPDGRNLYTASLDGTVRVWDVPTNTCVDWMTFASAPTALTLSTTGEFLATAHEGRLGISLWCDRSFFQTVHLNGADPPSKPFQMDEPAAAAEEEDEDALAQRVLDDRTNAFISTGQATPSMEDNGDVDDEKIIVPKRDGLITLSGLPAAHWKNLFHLELVKERNKPSEAPQKPPSAPFFLQWRGGENATNPEVAPKNSDSAKDTKPDDVEWEAAWSDDGGKDQENTNIEIKRDVKRKNKEEVETMGTEAIEIAKKPKIRHFRSELASLLERCSTSNNFEAVTEHLAEMGPSAIDVAFSALCHGMHDLDEGLRFLHLCSMWLLESCNSRKNYEVINAYMHRFFHIHATTIAGIDASTDNEMVDSPDHEVEIRQGLLETIKQLKISQISSTEGLRNKMQETLCLLRHFSRMV